MIVRYCEYCGPRVVRSDIDKESRRIPDAIPCPTCGLDPAEIRMIEEVAEVGFAEALRRENARGQAV